MKDGKALCFSVFSLFVLFNIWLLFILYTVFLSRKYCEEIFLVLY